MQEIASHGNGTYMNAEPDDRCPVCHGSGWDAFKVPVEMYGGALALFARKCRYCNGNHDQIVREAKEIADIPEELTLSNFNWSKYPGYDLTREKKIVSQFVEHFGKFEEKGMGLFLTSKTKGSGKTHLAHCLGGELINRYEASTMFVNASDLLNIVQRKNDSGRNPIDRMIDCRVLILDDLGQKLTGRDWLTDELFNIIDKRYQKKRVIIITSNCPLPELDFDDRIIDRLNAMTCLVRLPEYCVRAQEANSRKKAILHELGID